MIVQLQNDPTAVIFARQLLEVGNNTVPAHPETGEISIPYDFYEVIESIKTNYKNHAWMS